jgi:hypothetical protein
MDGGVGRAKTVDGKEEVSNCLVLIEWSPDSLIVREERRGEFRGIQISLLDPDIDCLAGGMGQEYRRGFVKDFGGRLFMQRLDRTSPVLAIDPVIENVLEIIDTRCIVQ